MSEYIVSNDSCKVTASSSHLGISRIQIVGESSGPKCRYLSEAKKPKRCPSLKMGDQVMFAQAEWLRGSVTLNFTAVG